VTTPTLASAVNISEGRDTAVIDLIAEACGDLLLDVHRDEDHHRSVLTLAGEMNELLRSLHALIRTAVRSLDLSRHAGVHPRFGVVDVVPFTPVGHNDLTPAIEARDRLAIWAGAALEVPCFLYGPMPDSGSRSLPEVRKGAFGTMLPDTGPDHPHPSAGAIAVGARGPLVAYNLWVSGLTLAETRVVARRVRNRRVRALGLATGRATQVSCNLIEPNAFGPADAYDLVAATLSEGAFIERAELVGLVPTAVLDHTSEERYEQLGLSAADSLEARLDDRSLRKRRS